MWSPNAISARWEVRRWEYLFASLTFGFFQEIHGLLLGVLPPLVFPLLESGDKLPVAGMYMHTLRQRVGGWRWQRAYIDGCGSGHKEMEVNKG